MARRLKPSRRYSSIRRSTSSAGTAGFIKPVVRSTSFLPGGLTVAQLEADVLGLQIRFQPFVRQLAAQTAFFPAAEGALRYRGYRIVDADDTRLESFGHAPGHG